MTDYTEVSCIAVALIAGLFFFIALVCAATGDCEIDREAQKKARLFKRAKRCFITALLVAGLGWIPMPWICFGLHSLWRMNIGAVNDIQRQEVVAPPSDTVRPSKAEKE